MDLIFIFHSIYLLLCYKPAVSAPSAKNSANMLENFPKCKFCSLIIHVKDNRILFIEQFSKRLFVLKLIRVLQITMSS
jgi:hypothetical protein